jgi:hypothetical protein
MPPAAGTGSGSDVVLTPPGGGGISRIAPEPFQ